MKRLTLSRKIKRNRRGSISAPAYILIVVLAAIGVIVGATTIRDQIVQEYGDVGVSLNNLDQSFSYTISIDTDNNGSLETVITRSYTDTGAFTAPDGTVDNAGAAPAGITIP